MRGTEDANRDHDGAGVKKTAMTEDRERLVRRYLDGEASPDEAREVDRLARDDAGFRRDLLAEAALDVQLAKAEGWRGELAAAGKGPALRPRFLKITLLAAAAVLVLGFGVVWYIATMEPITIIVVPTAALKERQRTQQPAAIPLRPTRELVAVVESVQGQATLRSSDSLETLQVNENGGIAEGDTLGTTSNSQVRVLYPDGTRLIVYSHTRLEFVAAAGGKLLQLDGGSVDVSVTPQPEGQPLQIYTTLLTAEVKGTEFRAIAEQTSSWVAVRSGSVRVFRHSDGRNCVLKRGTYAVIKKGMPFGAVPATCPLWQGECRSAVGDRYP